MAVTLSGIEDFVPAKTQNPPCISASAGFGFEVVNEGCLFFAGLAATYSSAS